ncbi:MULTISPECIES: FAD-dependent monooxygenase [Xanthomonas]|uniref:FAD-dependent monooxygenase n=1 Tax=Xanthomonas rydalmerensis TaxID=3046274 RepID=A0ABZ0JK65_9XANT|nr:MULTISPECIES: FAD-dependent monooxygenase [unclassified Xanthomonas]MBB5877031.1 2-polyprenyl-6-methoxyphenol hydroxylase-like FAD-dependent oxidoreductase [Xanthomonas sp. 3498]WOS40193.1 FAD-dependent monooxygenase [Xanthomonas sp. DM-2023]WOS44377.1 FAD-dependent monooxygenase [Xanthomonas sp. DM-2023]WOS48557.1 FAD-dependent monooxygenase [Xanthomonas sp. DM-2023]WOS52737.1 FAD-dependent monooxygenase [Xanthomonas sp. DM-2023]
MRSLVACERVTGVSVGGTDVAPVNGSLLHAGNGAGCKHTLTQGSAMNTHGDMLSTDVLIVGAGPSGLALRLALDRLGITSLLIDRHPAGLNTSRAAVIHARTLEVLEPLGVVPRLLAAGVKTTRFRVRDSDRVLLQIGFDDLPSTHRYALMCPQSATEAILGDGIGPDSATVWRPARLLSFAQAADGISADLELPQQRRQLVRAQWIVGCDGAHSTVRQGAGIAFEGGDYTETFVLADVRMAWPLPREEVSLFFSPQGLMVVAPLPEPDGAAGDRHRIVATVTDTAGPPTLSQMQALLDARGPRSARGRIDTLLWSSDFHLQHRVAAQMRHGRVLLCGDAAHVHSPAGGQGMNTGIQDAIALAPALQRALHQQDDHDLDAWASRRHRIARGVVRMTDAMTRAATATAPVTRTVRNGLLGLIDRAPPIQRRLAARLAELGN